MSGTRIIGYVGAAASVLGLIGPATAAAGTGGVAAPERPTVRAASCTGAPAGVCPRGAELQIAGDGLAATRSVVFLGRNGRRDDRRVTPTSRDDQSLSVVVPGGARSGPVQIATAAGDRVAAARRLVIRAQAVAPAAPDASAATSSLPAGVAFLDGPPATFSYSLSETGAGARVELYRVGDGAALQSWPAAASGEIEWDARLNGKPATAGRYGFRVTGAQAGKAIASAGSSNEFDLLDHIFPIRGKHDLGQSAINRFGGGRGHQGQDMFAACGTPLVAARGGKVVKATFESRAGNYVVIAAGDGQSNVYMHMKSAALVRAGDTVTTGQPIGMVGDSGHADGCHLHFELWTAPGWYAGGKAIDPLPSLTAWDAQS